MNALLLMTSTFMAGADPVAVAPAPAAACCADACDPCAKKPGILDKLKARLHSRKSCCEPAPTCCEKPAPAPKCCAPAPTCDPCAARPNCLDKLKARLHSRKSDCCAPACDGCAAAPATPPTTTPPPKDLPKPMDKKTGTDAPPTITIPSPGAFNVPTIPVTPVSGGKLTNVNSPY